MAECRLSIFVIFVSTPSSNCYILIYAEWNAYSVARTNQKLAQTAGDPNFAGRNLALKKQFNTVMMSKAKLFVGVATEGQKIR